MSKQTNSFQQLVRRIHETFYAPGSTVAESAMSTEPDGTLREIDVLIETDVGGHRVKIAVECRDRKKTETIEWIDSVVGKYADLRVDKIVLISRSGFSAAAECKAQRKGIQLFQLDLLEHAESWPKSLTAVWLVPYHEHVLMNVVCEFTNGPRVPHDGPLEFSIEKFSEFARHVRAEWARAREQISAEVQGCRQKIADLPTPLYADFRPSFPLPEGVQCRFCGTSVPIAGVLVNVKFWGEAIVAEHSRHLLAQVGTVAPGPVKVVTEVLYAIGAQAMRATLVQEEHDGGVRWKIEHVGEKS